MLVIWHGTPDEAAQLTEALQRNCECAFNEYGARVSTCAGHRALVEDQRFADGLLWARRVREKLQQEEDAA